MAYFVTVRLFYFISGWLVFPTDNWENICHKPLENKISYEKKTVKLEWYDLSELTLYLWLANFRDTA